tara:strand:- start:189 stop:536 length:348 start_codon:yes stop_codon:yes gene_type:complete
MRVILVLLFVISCGTYTPKPTIKHVLAVTSEGDTLLLPIDKIRPNIYRSIYPLYGRNWDSYYYNGWQYNTNVYSNYRNYEPKNNIDNSNNNFKPKYESKDISRSDVNDSKIKMKQ